MANLYNLNSAVVYDAKIRIIKQITTYSTIWFCKSCCCLWCKDKNNKANHNHNIFFLKFRNAVVYDAKIRIIKQITTVAEKPAAVTGCCLWCKDKNNKANHNDLQDAITHDLAVVYDAKIRIIKQITTKLYLHFFAWALLFMMQR